jgi:uncharacterized protein RhaS with RHS repeats
LVRTVTEGGATTTRYVHADQVGSTELTTDESGNVIDRVAYLPFGQPIAPTPPAIYAGAGPTPGFAGRAVDAGTGFMDFKGRVYDPRQGLSMTRPSSMSAMTSFSDPLT